MRQVLPFDWFTEFFCLFPSLARLYSAAASPSERLRSDGSLAKNNSCTQFAREDVGLWPFYNSYVIKRKLFTTKFSQTILRNHLGFIQHLQLNYVSCKVKVDSLTFINFQENYQTAEIYFHSSHVTPLNKTVSNYCVN